VGSRFGVSTEKLEALSEYAKSPLFSDADFSLYLRRSFAKSMGYPGDAGAPEGRDMRR
jgi:hypothetical protein